MRAAILLMATIALIGFAACGGGSSHADGGTPLPTDGGTASAHDAGATTDGGTTDGSDVGTAGAHITANWNCNDGTGKISTGSITLTPTTFGNRFTCAFTPAKIELESVKGGYDLNFFIESDYNGPGTYTVTNNGSNGDEVYALIPGGCPDEASPFVLSSSCTVTIDKHTTTTVQGSYVCHEGIVEGTPAPSGTISGDFAYGPKDCGS